MQTSFILGLLSVASAAAFTQEASARAWVKGEASFQGEILVTAGMGKNADLGEAVPQQEPAGLKGMCDNVDQQAGYFKITGSKNAHYFYWFFESRDMKSDAPVILWMTGGPGCSSGVALFHENGPCKVGTEIGGKFTNPINPYSWNSNASIIYIDQPVGVGFSYGDAQDSVHNESGVAEDMFQFLQSFSAANGDMLKTRPFFIFGESYGGHYAPSVAHRVAMDGTLNLQGLGVGNGLTDPVHQYPKYPEMVSSWSRTVTGHDVVPTGQIKQMQEAMPKCVAMITACQTDTSACPAAQAFCNNAEIGPYQATGLNPYDIREPCKIKPLCYDFSDVQRFLDAPATRAALGVPDTTVPGWQSCNFTVNAAFAADWMKSFADTVPDLLAKNVRVLIYAGDVDFICNWLGNKAWTLALDWPHKAEFNAAPDADWKVDGASAGKARTANGLTFLQVHLAGHMVPLDKPKEALSMLTTFLNGGSFAAAADE